MLRYCRARPHAHEAQCPCRRLSPADRVHDISGTGPTRRGPPSRSSKRVEGNTVGLTLSPLSDFTIGLIENKLPVNQPALSPSPPLPSSAFPVRNTETAKINVKGADRGIKIYIVSGRALFPSKNRSEVFIKVCNTPRRKLKCTLTGAKRFLCTGVPQSTSCRFREN